MKLEYICRYCRSFVGAIEQGEWSDQELGFDLLTPEEREDIITININGDRQVNVVCETCQQILEKNPDLCLLPQLYH